MGFKLMFDKQKLMTNFGVYTITSLEGWIFIDDSSIKLWVYILKNTFHVFNAFKR